MALPKGRSVVVAGCAAAAGVGVALGFTVLDSTTSTWLLVLATAIPLGVSPVVAGWLSPELKHAWFFPIGVLASLSIASAIYGPLSSDSEPIAFVVMLTFIYGGGASLVAVCCSIALTVLFIAIPLASLTSTRAPYWSAILAPIGLIGVAAGSAIIWSDRNRGRWSSLGLGLSLLCLGTSIGTPVYWGASVVKGLVYTATG